MLIHHYIYLTVLSCSNRISYTCKNLLNSYYHENSLNLLISTMALKFSIHKVVKDVCWHLRLLKRALKGTITEFGKQRKVKIEQAKTRNVCR